MDSQVKERIVGAAVLVALGVWLIPLILDGPAETEAEGEAERALVLPAADSIAPVRTETVELGSPTARDAPGDDGGAGTARAVPEEALPAARAVPDSTATRADAADEDEPAGRVAAGPQAEAPAAAAATEPGERPPAPGAWMVQVGAFSELANARQSVERLASLGYEASVSDYRADARTLYRVRVGGFATREEAERVQDALSAHRFVPKVVQAE